MNSLRSRLILGSSLIAVIPLAIAIYLLSHRIEAMVRTQASERLDSALGGLRAELESDAETMAGRIRVLARDPQLRRLYLVRPAGSAELPEYLAERRYLLGLDLLQISDPSGVMVAEGAAIPATVASVTREPSRIVATGGGEPAGLTLERVAGDSALAIVARAPVRYEGRTVGVVAGGVVLGTEYLVRLREASGVDLLIGDADGRPIATSRGGHVGAAALDRQSYLTRGFPIAIGSPPHARITGFVSTAAADGAIAALQWTAILLGLFGLALATLLGLLWSSQISRPVERLAALSHRLAQGHWDEPVTLRSVRELETLVAALDRMRADLKNYRERLVTSERHAAWGQMARQVAHEVSNPLTPIAVSVADLKRSYDLGRPDFPQILDRAVGTIGEELATLRRLLQEFSDFGRLPPPRLVPCRLDDLLTDLSALYSGDVAEGRLAFSRADREIILSADRGQLRQALVNLIKNGLEAVDGDGRVAVSARMEPEGLTITVSNTGPGLTAEQRAHLFVPGFSTKAHGSGLGLTIVERIVNDHQGTIEVDSGPGGGITFRIRLPLAPPTAPPAAHAEPPRT